MLTPEIIKNLEALTPVGGMVTIPVVHLRSLIAHYRAEQPPEAWWQPLIDAEPQDRRTFLQAVGYEIERNPEAIVQRVDEMLASVCFPDLRTTDLLELLRLTFPHGTKMKYWVRGYANAVGLAKKRGEQASAKALDRLFVIYQSNLTKEISDAQV